MEDAKKECIFCGNEVSISLSTLCDQPTEKSTILKLWNNECAKTICEILLGEEFLWIFLQYFQDYNFCANCDQTARDIQYFTFQIDAFKKRIRTLTQLIRSHLLQSSEDISKNTDHKQVKSLNSRISALIEVGSKGLTLYTRQHICEIMYKMASDKCSKDSETEKNHFMQSNTEIFNENSTNSEYKSEEMEPEIKIEIVENWMDDYNNTEDHVAKDFLDHSTYSNEVGIEPDFAIAESSDGKRNTRISISSKDEETSIGSEDNEDKSSEAVDGSDLKSDDDMSIRYKKFVKKSPKSRKRNVSAPTPKKKLARERESRQKLRLSRMRDIERQNKRQLAAKLAKIDEDPVQKILMALKPEYTEEERLARKTMTAKERLQLSQTLQNKRKRYKRLAEKIVKSFVCPADNCDQFFPTKNETDGHFREIHEGNIVDAYHCEHCPETFSELDLLYDHNKERQRNGTCVGKEECKFCGRRYTTEIELNVHLSEAHSGPNPFRCAFCEKELSNSIDLRKHTKEFHPDVGEIFCEVCGKILPLSKIKKHKGWHARIGRARVRNQQNSDEIFVCEICAKEFVGKSKFNMHMRCHVRPYKCSICDKQFTTSYNVRNHEITHTAIREYVCLICGKGFIRETRLRTHELKYGGKCVSVPRNSRKRKRKKIIKTCGVNTS